MHDWRYQHSVTTARLCKIRGVKWLRKWTVCRLPWPIFWHNAEIVETYDSQTRKLRCIDCERYFAMSDRHKAVLPWDEEYEKIICDMYGIPRTKR